MADSVAAIQADLEARGIADRVLVHVWSEFGRHAAENGSTGTDHGASGTSLRVGLGQRNDDWRIARSNQSGFGRQPARGNLRENVDFRGVDCSLLEQWFGHDAGSVIPNASSFVRYRLLRRAESGSELG